MSGSKSSLNEKLNTMSHECVACDICVKECAFLQKYGNPKQIAMNYGITADQPEHMAFECSLCSLCTAVCPVGLDPSALFLQMREHKALKGIEEKKYNRILSYEMRGTSKRYTYYGLPANCNTVFFPGCTLPGTRPKTTLKLIELLQNEIPTLGVVLDCCTKPSHDLGYASYFNQMFGELHQFLTDHKVQNIIVACPNCYKIFQEYGSPLSVRTVYEYLLEFESPSIRANLQKTVSIHDPCPMRFETPVLDAVRDLLANMGCTVAEMPHTRKNTLCCGEGGAVALVAEDLANSWRKTRISELKDHPLITYCAGCAGFLSGYVPTHHLLDIMFEPEKTINKKARVSTAPFTYFNRLRLKQKLKKLIPAKINRERTYKAKKD